jgi:rhamnosyltransferase
MTPGVSVVVRTFNSTATLDHALSSVRMQSIAAELVIVDSGSTDGSAQRGAAVADRFETCVPYTPGRALNIGARTATAPVVAPLSSHSAFEHDKWLETAVDWFDNPEVAAVCGMLQDPYGNPLRWPFRQTLEDARQNPYWGLSNTAAAWRRDLVLNDPFPEDVPMAEDKVWAWGQLMQGRVVVVDPALAVAAGHRRGAGARAYFARRWMENYGFAVYLPVERFGVSEAASAWLASDAPPGIPSCRRLGRTRAIEVVSKYLAYRAASRVRPEPDDRVRSTGKRS